MPRSFAEWLLFIQSIHATEMDLSLERVMTVAARLKLMPSNHLIVTVAGTNGKGSCVAGLEAIYLAAGYRVGAFTSPFLWRYNEQVRLQGKETEDDVFCQAFAIVENARQEISLTPFEFNTLAALVIFQQAKLDIVILEVGLGGRFDAVNVMDAEVALVASIDIDHAEWLGNTREKIAFEKAGIFRTGKPAVCGDLDVPASLIDYAHEVQAPLFCQNKEFSYKKNETTWDWNSTTTILRNLPIPTLALQNMASVLMVVELLQKRFPVSKTAIDQAFKKVTLPGRIQVIKGRITHILDVSHNPAAAKWLATYLFQHNISGQTRAVFSMLADKDIGQTIDIMRNAIDEWFVAPLAVKRGASLAILTAHFQNQDRVNTFSSIKDAYHAAHECSKEHDRIIVFGSFHTVSAVYPQQFEILNARA